jgi:hypothetical protein
MTKHYAAYRHGMNAKGLSLKTPEEANPKVSTERGQRRRARERKVHVHEWVNCVPVVNPSYHPARVSNETRYYCKIQGSRAPGGGKRKGCGATCRNPK